MGIIIVEDILQNKLTWKKVFDHYYDQAKLRLGEDDSFFTETVSYKLTKHDQIRRMYITDFIVNLLLWKPRIYFKGPITENIIYDGSKSVKNSIRNRLSEYFNENIIDAFRWKYEVKELNLAIATCIEGLSQINKDFGVIFSITSSLKDIIDLSKKSKRFDDIIHTDLDNTIQPKEAEEFIRTQSKELLDILTTNENLFSPMFASGVGINVDQFNEYMINVGFKPDLDGSIIALAINTNYLVKGLNRPSHYFSDAKVGRKAAIMNKKHTSEAGYFARKLSMSCSDIVLISDPHYDCGTKHPVWVKLDTVSKIEKLQGRYYKLTPNQIFYRKLNFKIDKDRLLGKEILLRTPITCACVDGICHKCYGRDLARMNAKDTNVGILAATELSAKFTQRILQSKHLLKSNSSEIIFPDIFHDLFIFDSGNIILNGNLSDKIKNNWSISIDINSIESDNEFDNIDYISSISAFSIINNKTEEEFIVSDENLSDMFLSNYITSFFNSPRYTKNEICTIPLKVLDPEEVLMSIQIINNELVKPLKDTMKLIDKKSKMDEPMYAGNIEELLRKFIDVTINAGIAPEIVHLEIILRNLIRSKENVFELPDYSKDEIDYDILSLQPALRRHPSVLVSLAFERIGEQLRSPLTYRKSKESIYDPFFMVDYRKGR